MSQETEGQTQPAERIAVLEQRVVALEKQLAAQTQHQEQTVRSLFEGISLGVHLYDLQPDGRLVFAGANAAANQILGIDHTPLVGMALEEAFPSLVDTEVPGRYRATAKDGTPWSAEQVDYRDGRISGAYQVCAVQTWPGSMAALFLDITPQLRLQSQLIEANVRLERQLKLTDAILTAVPTPIFYKDRQGRYLGCNPAFSRQLGIPHQELIGRTVDDVWPPEHAQVYRAMDQALLAHPERQIYETQVRDRNGRDRDAIFAKNVFYDENGDFAGIVGAYIDITERKQATEELHGNVARLTALIENLQMGVLMESEDRRILHANQALCDLLDAPNPQMLIGLDCETAARTIRTLFADPQGFVEGISARLAAQEIAIGEQLALADGRVFERDYVPIRAGDEPAGHLWLYRDITRQVRTEQALLESEQKYRTLVEKSLQAVAILQDGPHPIRYVNSRIEAILGYTPAELELFDQAAFKQLIHPEDREDLIRRFQRRIGGDEFPRRRRYRLIHRSGETRWVDAYSSRLEYAGKPSLLLALLDITERKRTEEERAALLARIQEQAHQVEQILETVPEGVVLLDAGGRILLANPVAAAALPFLTGEPATEVLTHLGDVPLAALLIPPMHGAWQDLKTDGRTFEVGARPIGDAEGNGWVLVLRDVTREREIQERAHQQERLAAVGQLAAGIAHDFNNITAIIVLYAQMTMRAGGLSGRQPEYMDIIRKQAMHASELIHQILDFSRRAVLERRPLDLLPLLKEQVKLLERTLPENIQVEIVYRPTAYRINADPTRIQQVITNLSVNARDAMPEGGVLSFSLERICIGKADTPPILEVTPGHWIRLTVADTGRGIPPEVIPHVFEPFFTTKDPGQGSGLGLAQVHGIVTQHKGAIDVKSRVGSGTEFTVYLPALPLPDDPGSDRDATKMPEELPGGQGATLLVVEDNPDAREALVESLSALDYAILAATDGREALALYDQYAGEIALVVTDIVMPEMGGMALLDALRQRDAAVPVMALTGHPPQEGDVTQQPIGFDAYLTKPTTLEVLAQTVRALLDRT